MINLTFSALIHDYSYLTFREWEQVPMDQMTALVVEAKQVNRHDIAELLQVIVRANYSEVIVTNDIAHDDEPSVRELRRQMIKRYKLAAQWAIGPHTDEYFSTIPRDCVDIINHFLHTEYHCTNPANYRYCTYFCGVRHSQKMPNSDWYAPATVCLWDRDVPHWHTEIFVWYWYGKRFQQQNLPQQIIYKSSGYEIMQDKKSVVYDTCPHYVLEYMSKMDEYIAIIMGKNNL